MRTALFGGTFDPIHTGHLLIAEAARETFRLDRVVFLPTGIPPHKQAAVASPAHRLAMVRLAIRSNPTFQVSAWEVRQGKIVYTTDTLDHFKRQWPRDTFFFIIGSDSLQNLDLWVSGRALLRKCRFLVAERPGVPWSACPRSLRKQVQRISSPSVGIASHLIRQQVCRRRSIRYQVPGAVERYILRQKLYHSS